MSNQLNRKQSTLCFHTSGRILTNRPGPKVKAPTTLTAASSAALIFGVRRRRKVGGVNEAEVIKAFKDSRAHHAIGEPDSGDDADEYSSDGDHRPRKKFKRTGYSREKKLQAITYFELTDMPGKKDTPDVPISASLACKNLGIDRSSLREWKRDKQRILRMKKGAMRYRGQSYGREPEMEFELHKEFVQARAEGMIISGKWFLVHARAIYRRLYPHRISQDEETGRFEYNLFSFSGTWFQGFKTRYRIVLRCKTKQAQKPPEDFREKIENWLKFNRRNTIINPNSDCGISCLLETPLVGRFKLSEIANMDQTPIAFEFLSGRTYDLKGTKSVWIKEQRSGWDRRQATLQVVVYADGINRCKPLLIFHGDPIGDSRRRTEVKLYDPRVRVAFNKTAWADGNNLKDWVKNQYTPASPYYLSDQEPRLLCLDAFAPQMTKSLRDEFKKINCTTSYIPGGCTGFIQVLDISLNKPLKALVAQQASDHADKYHERYVAGGFTVGERRVLLTQWVGAAWVELHIKYKNTIIDTFRRVGLSLNPDGSEDQEIKINGLDDIKVGDFTRTEPGLEDGLGSLTIGDIAIVEAAQVKLAVRIAKATAKHKAKVARGANKIKAGIVFPEYANLNGEDYDIDNLPNAETGEKDPVEESTEDEEEHEEVFTLGRMNTRSQTRVSRYFTAAEVEANEAIQEAKDTGKGKEKEVVPGLWNILRDDETIEVDLDQSDTEEDDDIEPEYDPTDDDDEDFDQDTDRDQDVADENME